ncbi:hypothetical protein ACN47E_010334 [Coniothyrium glycines]
MKKSFGKLMLLAAFSASSSAGPVPVNSHRSFLDSYANSSLSAGPALTSSATSTAHEILPKSFHSNVVEADTAVIVEPIQQTVFTSVVPAITFLDPQGNPLATGDPQTFLSTSYITPTPVPSVPRPSSTTLSLRSVSSPVPSAAKPRLTRASSGKPSFVPSSSLAIVENGTVPQFTYSPEGEEPATISSISVSVSPTSNSTRPTTGSLPGFNHPGSRSRAATAPGSVVNMTSLVSYMISTVYTSAPAAAVTSASTRSSSRSSSAASRVLVTETEYTTVYGTPPSTEVISGPSDVPLLPTEAQENLSSSVISSIIITTSVYSGQSRSLTSQISSSMAYTTIIATSVPVESLGQISTSPVATAPISTSPDVSSAQVAPSTSQLVATHTFSTPLPELTVSSFESTGTSSEPFPSAAPPAPPSSQIASDIPPTPTASQVLSISTSGPTPSSEGPLVITPIPPSQIFTVTVTETEKETVRETTTITVTA